MGKIFFLSHFINNHILLYGGAGEINVKSNTAIVEGDTANTLTISFPNHSGTHVDVPYHFINEGKRLTEYPASFWIFNCPQCINVPSEDGYLVTNEDIEEKINDNTDLLLIRTGYEKHRNKTRYWQRNPGLSLSLAKILRLQYPSIRAIGIDTISVTSLVHRDEGRKAHREFLGSHYKSEPIILIEDMALSNYNDHITQVIVLPLMIEEADGAPCTVLAR